ncbi:MAG: hypothetical protein CME88_12670 [Hirschia sp.]|nr:hypothetical protein [Hirschia sp.]MBF19221.1 hypothetical protein [Hirschia sp.]|tara:strand:+ start:139 stop:375 length:237 start_codon:yes stop_codon:yes gene_type:complete
MLGRILWTIIGAVGVVFIITMTLFYVQTGSFEGAGARMDDIFASAGDEAEIAVQSAADRTGDVIEDIADGSDETRTDY